MRKRIIQSILKILPVIYLEKIMQIESFTKIRKYARRALSKRNVVLQYGVGEGLKYNAGGYDPDTTLGIYELPVQNALSKNLKAGEVFYDIGANVGFFSIIGANLVGSTGTVYAFEPDPSNVAKIRHNSQLNSFHNITILEKAAFHSSGEGQLLITEFPGSRTLTTTAKSSGKKYEKSPQVSVDLIAIDDLVESNDILPPTVMKIDIEGAELDALKGLRQTIKKFKPTIIYEVDDSLQNGYSQKKGKIDQFVQNLGYEIEVLEKSYVNTSHYVGHVVAKPITS